MKNKIKYLLPLLLLVDLFSVSSCNNASKTLKREVYEDVINLSLYNFEDKDDKEVTLVPISHYFGNIDGYELLTLDLGDTSSPSVHGELFDIPKKNHYLPLIYKDHKMSYLTSNFRMNAYKSIDLSKIEPSTVDKIEKILNDFDYPTISKYDQIYLGYYNYKKLDFSKRDRIAFLCSYDFNQTYISSVSYLNVNERDYGRVLDYDVSLYNAYLDSRDEKMMKNVNIANFDFILPRSYDFVLSHEESGKTITLGKAYQEKLVSKEQVEEIYNKHRRYYKFYYEYNSFLHFC